MSRTTRRGRPQRHYRIRVRTERRDPIDYAKLAQAALEQAAMETHDAESSPSLPPRNAEHSEQQTATPKEADHDRLA